MHPGTFLAAFVYAVLPAAFLLAAIYFLDRYEKEPLKLLLVALVAGAVVAPAVAFGIEKLVDKNLATSMVSQSSVPVGLAQINRPVIEEIVKGLVILAVFFLVRYEIDDLLDGLVYGGVVGVGFGLAATFVAIKTTHFTTGISSPGATVQSTNVSLFTTMVASTNQVFYCGVIGLVLATARKASLARVAGAAVVGIGLAMGFHLVHDYLPQWVASSSSDASSSGVSSFLTNAPNFFGLFALAVIATWAVGREKVLIGQELQDEVTAGVVTREDYATVTNSMRRLSAMTKALLKGKGEYGKRRRLYSLEIELAFRKRHRREDRMQAKKYLDEDVYRQRIAETRAGLAGAGTEVAR